MSKQKRINLILTLTVFVSLIILIPLSSCSKNDDLEVNFPGNNEENSEDPEINTDEESSFKLPDEFPSIYSYGYVSLSEEISQQYKEYTGFIVSFNSDNHTPNYVAWELLSEELSGSANRNDYTFWQDPYLEGCPTKDYAYSIYGYERGHMCPAAEQKWSPEAMRDCFVMANMCPQIGDLNGGAWEKLEEKERSWARKLKSIWIVAGPIYYENDDLRIGFSQVRVPSAFFKAILYVDSENPKGIAFIYPNSDAPGNMEDYAMSIDDLEKETGYDFFPALDDYVENIIESTFSFSDWNK